MAATLVPKGLGPQNPTKNWARLWVNQYLKNQFSKFPSLNPPCISEGTDIALYADETEELPLEGLRCVQCY